MTSSSNSHSLRGLLGWLLLVFAVAALGAMASVQAQAFYAQLSKPSWAPPAGVFGPVWSVLYGLMGMAVWLVWRARPAAHSAFVLFGAQLAVNALWSWLFFAWKQGALAMLDVVVLWVLIAATMRVFWPIHRLAALLLLPYFMWVGFASLLTWVIWQGNPGLLS